LALSLPTQREERDATRDDPETGALSPRRRAPSNAGPLAMPTRRASTASKPDVLLKRVDEEPVKAEQPAESTPIKSQAPEKPKESTAAANSTPSPEDERDPQKCIIS